MGGEREEVLRSLKTYAVEPTIPEIDIIARVLHEVPVSISH